MKHRFKLALACFAFLSLFNYVNAQGTYIKVGAGYNLPMAGTSMVVTSEHFDQPGQLATGSTKIKYVTFGKGINFDLVAGYMFTKNIGIDIGASYLEGATFKSSIKNESAEYFHLNETESSISMLRLIPSFVLASGGERINIYSRVGIAIGTFGRIKESYLSENKEKNLPERKIESTWIKTGNTALGLAAATGVSIKMTSKFSFFGEISLVSLSYAPAKGKLTVYKVNNEDKLSETSVSNKEVVYLSEPIPFVMENDKPNQLWLEAHPMSSIGLNFGLKLNL